MPPASEASPVPFQRREPHRLRVLAGACGLGIGLGLIRSDFGVIGREMVVQEWVSQADLGELAALNMVGYLLGCVHQAQLKGKAQLLRSLRLALVVGVLCLWFGAVQSGQLGEGGLRVLAGWSAGHLMSGVPGLALAGVPSRHQRQAVATVMGGGALVALLGASAVAWLAPDSAAAAWLVVACFATVLALPTLWLINRGHRRWREVGKPGDQQLRDEQPRDEQRESEQQVAMHDSGVTAICWFPLIALTLAFALAGAAQVPMALYEPIVASNRIGLDGSMSSASFSAMGLGGLMGSLMLLGLPRALPTALLLPAVAAVGGLGAWVYALARSPQLLLLSAFLIGWWSIMTSSLTLDRLPDLVPAELQRRCWATFTTLNGLGFVICSMGTRSMAFTGLQTLLWLGVTLMAGVLLAQMCQVFRRSQPGNQSC